MSRQLTFDSINADEVALRALQIAVPRLTVLGTMHATEHLVDGVVAGLRAGLVNQGSLDSLRRFLLQRDRRSLDEQMPFPAGRAIVTIKALDESLRIALREVDRLRETLVAVTPNEARPSSVQS